VSRRRFTLDDLSPAQREAAAAQLAGGALAVPVGATSARVSVSARAASTSAVRSPHTGKSGKRGMSKLEERFAKHCASVGVLALYEPLSVALPGKRSRYRPDFLTAGLGWWEGPRTDGPSVLVEVKPRGKDGRPYWTQASRLRALTAAGVLRGLIRLVVAWPVGRDEWACEEVGA